MSWQKGGFICTPGFPLDPSLDKYTSSLQVSCIASSPAFRNRVLFPRYFQLLPTDASQADAFYAIIKHYNWRRVALIVQDENLFTVVKNEHVVHNTNLFSGW